MRAVLLAMAVGALAGASAGCGGTAPADAGGEPPTAVVTRYVAAVRAGDAKAVRSVLSKRFIDHYDLTDERLESSFIPAIKSDMGPVGRTLEPAFERVLRDDLAVAAFKDATKRPLPGPRAFAVPLVAEDGAWKVEPFGLDLSYGYPDDLSADPRRPFVSFGVNARGRPDARLWIDGKDLPLRRQEGTFITFEGRPARPLSKGRHTVVAFAKSGTRVGALAWTIRVR